MVLISAVRGGSHLRRAVRLDMSSSEGLWYVRCAKVEWVLEMTRLGAALRLPERWSRTKGAICKYLSRERWQNPNRRCLYQELGLLSTLVLVRMLPEKTERCPRLAASYRRQESANRLGKGRRETIPVVRPGIPCLLETGK